MRIALCDFHEPTTHTFLGPKRQQEKPQPVTSKHHTDSNTVIGGDDLLLEGEHFFQLTPEAIMKPSIEEGIATGGAHCKPVAKQLDKEEIVLVDKADVDVTDDVENVDREPADCKGRHHQHEEAEDLPLSYPVKFCLTLCRVARHDPVFELDCDTEVREGDSREWQDVGDDQGGVGIGQALLLSVHPELLADGKAFFLELHVVGVSNCWGHQHTGEQPDPTDDIHTGTEGDALFKRVHSGVIPGKKARVVSLRSCCSKSPSDVHRGARGSNNLSPSLWGTPSNAFGCHPHHRPCPATLTAAIVPPTETFGTVELEMA